MALPLAIKRLPNRKGKKGKRGSRKIKTRRTRTSAAELVNDDENVKVVKFLL